jgi:hypothetical protein
VDEVLREALKVSGKDKYQELIKERDERYLDLFGKQTPEEKERSEKESEEGGEGEKRPTVLTH